MPKPKGYKLPRSGSLQLGEISDLSELPVVNFDGACVPNPGKMGLGACIRLHKDHDYYYSQHSQCAGAGTNNLAEWLSLELAISAAIVSNIHSCTFLGDSDLIVNQINGRWAINNEEHLKVARRCFVLLERMNQVKIEWIPREKNVEADRLSNIGLEAE